MTEDTSGNVSCTVSNREAYAVTVTAQCLQLGTADYVSKAYDIVIKTSLTSATANNSSVSVVCDSGYTLTGCSCYSTANSCGEGAKIESNVCKAVTDGDDGTVQAIATCLKLTGGQTLKTQDLVGTKSGITDDTTSIANCGSNYKLTGCSCSQSGYDVCEDGAKFNENNTCTAYMDSDFIGGVYAYARCLKVE